MGDSGAHTCQAGRTVGYGPIAKNSLTLLAQGSIFGVRELADTEDMVRKVPQIFVLLALCASLALAGAIKENSLSGTSNGNAITIRWLSEDETGVLRFELERKAGLNGQFFLLSTVVPKGSGSAYEYVDESAFRTTENLYQYRVKVVFSNGSSVDYGPITVSHKTSDVKRTWGSIKAMFR